MSPPVTPPLQDAFQAVSPIRSTTRPFSFATLGAVDYNSIGRSTTRSMSRFAMPSSRTLLAVGFWSVAHFIVALAAVFVALLFGEHAMEGNPATSSDGLASSLAYLLMSPGLPIALRFGIHNDAAEWLLVIGNSMLWGIALYWFARFLRSLGRSPD